MTMRLVEALTEPVELYSRQMVLTKPSPVPQANGIYAWYFKEVPAGVPKNGCVTRGDLTLLYVGISPSRPKSKHNLRKRIAYHYRGNAEGSTLRLTLGVLLTERSGFSLRRVGSGKRMTFTHIGEQWLDDWMQKNAFVCWQEHPEPWKVEGEMLRKLSLPLNIQDNEHHEFSSKLSGLRRDAKRIACELPIAREDNQARRPPGGGNLT